MTFRTFKQQDVALSVANGPTASKVPGTILDQIIHSYATFVTCDATLIRNLHAAEMQKLKAMHKFQQIDFNIYENPCWREYIGHDKHG